MSLDYGIGLATMRTGLQDALGAFDRVSYGMLSGRMKAGGSEALEETERHLTLVQATMDSIEGHEFPRERLGEFTSDPEVPAWIAAHPDLKRRFKGHHSTVMNRAFAGVRLLQRGEQATYTPLTKQIHRGTRATIQEALDDVSGWQRANGNWQAAAATVERLRGMQDDILYAVDRPRRLEIEADTAVNRMIDSPALTQ